MKHYIKMFALDYFKENSYNNESEPENYDENGNYSFSEFWYHDDIEIKEFTVDVHADGFVSGFTYLDSSNLVKSLKLPPSPGKNTIITIIKNYCLQQGWNNVEISYCTRDVKVHSKQSVLYC